jgi:GNAT superfamily N-acetyltransferase
MPKCPLTSVPGYEDSKGITNPALEIKINQVFDKEGQINLPFSRRQWMELYREAPLSEEAYKLIYRNKADARRYRGKVKGLDNYRKGEQLPLPMGRQEWYDLYGILPKSKKSKEIFNKISDEVKNRKEYVPKQKDKDYELTIKHSDDSSKFEIVSEEFSEETGEPLYQLKASLINRGERTEGMQITFVHVDKSLRRKGVAYRMHTTALEYAYSKNQNLYSDDTITEPILDLFNHMKEMGYNVYFSDDIVESPVPGIEDAKQFYTKSGRPAVTVYKPITFKRN